MNGKMLKSCSLSGWKVLNFLEELETSGTFFDEKKIQVVNVVYFSCTVAC